MCLASIFNYGQTILASQAKDRIPVAHLTVEMHWYHGGHWSVIPQTDEVSRFIPGALLFKKSLQHLDRHVVGVFVDVNEFRNGSGLRDGLSRCNKRMWYGHDNVAWLNSSSHN